MMVRSVVTAVTLCVAMAAWASTALAQAPAPQRGGVLRMIDASEPRTLNGGLTTGFSELTVSTKVFSGLLEYGWDFAPRPSLAEKWSISDDLKTFTFQLRRNVQWHDGKPFTSADVKYSFEEVLRRFHPRARSVLNPLDHVDTPDPFTAIVRMKQSHPAFIKLLGASEAPILPKHLYDGTDPRQNPYNAKPVGTGPFRFVEWQPRSHVILERNPSYWRPNRPYLDKIVLQIVPDQATRVAIMEKGDADLSHLSGIPFHEAERMGKLPHLAVVTKGYEAFSGVAHVELNVRKPPLNNVKVRQALAHAVDKEFVRKTIWFGFGRVATGPINSVLKDFHNPAVPRYAYDLKRAEQLLDEAGFPRGAGGTRFPLNVTYNPFREEYARLAEYLRAQLDRVGIAAKVQTYDALGWMSKVFTDWDFDLDANLLNNFPDPSSGVERGYTSKGTQKGVPFANSMGYSNPTVDELFARAAVETNAKRRRDLYNQAQEILVREVPALWLLELDWVTVMNKELENVVTSPWGLYDSYDEVFFRKRG